MPSLRTSMPWSKSFKRDGQPAISVDTKKKENVGDFKNAGYASPQRRAPSRCGSMTSSSRTRAKSRPSGSMTSRPTRAGSMSASIMTRQLLPLRASDAGGTGLARNVMPEKPNVFLITTDCGGSNGYRGIVPVESRITEAGQRTGLSIIVAHPPARAPAMNRIEHRIPFISINWRGRPLLSHSGRRPTDCLHKDRNRFEYRLRHRLGALSEGHQDPKGSPERAQHQI